VTQFYLFKNSYEDMIFHMTDSRGDSRQ